MSHGQDYQVQCTAIQVSITLFNSAAYLSNFDFIVMLRMQRKPNNTLQTQSHPLNTREFMSLTTAHISEISSNTSQMIKLASWPCESPKAIVHILHGMGEHKYRYQHFAEFLNKNAIHVYAHDHLGHGDAIDTQNPKGHFGDDDGFKKVVSNVDAVQQHIQSLHPDLPVYLLGHSMGSFIAQSYLINYPSTVKGVILSGSALTPRLLVRALSVVAKIETLRLGKRGTSQLMNFLTFGSYNNSFKPIRTASDWLSRDTLVVDNYIHDPLCGFICSCASWLQLAEALLDISLPTNLQKIPADLPTLIISGGKDPVGGFGKYVKALEALWRNTKHTQVSCHLIKDARHEVLNETNKELTYNLLLQWLRDL